jgi:nitroreductase
MNEAVKSLLTRRSCRSYKSEQIKKDELETVLKIATYAPTAMGTQSPLIVVVQDSEELKELSRLNASVWGRENVDPFYGAPTAVFVFYDSENKNGVQDASLVMGNLLNGAHAVGLASCWINRAYEQFRLPEGEKYKKKWNIPENYEGIGICILGYAEGALPDPKPRKKDYVIWSK